MTNVLKKAFTWSVVAVTILWSVGFAAFAPMIAQAAECPELEAGDLWKTASKSAVYMQNEDGEALAFPNEKTFLSWGFSFADVVTLSNSCAEDIELAGFVPYAPGTLVYREGFGTVYVVGMDGAVTPFADYTALNAVFGANAVSKARSVGDSHWLAAYDNTGDELDGEMLPDGIFVKTSASSKVYFVLDGMLYDVEGTVPAPWTVVTVSADLLDSVEMADESMTPSEVAGSALDEVLMGSGSTSGSGSETPATSGSLSLSLNAGTPDSANIVTGVDNVPFTKVNFKAGSSDVIVNAVKIGRSGLGATSNFTSVTLYDGTTKLGTTKTSWNSDNTMTYNISGGWKIPAGTTKVLSITANVASSSSYNALGVVGVTVGAGTVTGYPVYGNQMSGVNVSVGTVTITNQGTAQTKKIGTQGVTLASFKLAVDSIEDGTLNQITLKNKAASNNASDSDVSNIYLYSGSTVLAGPVSMTNDKITFVLDNGRKIESSKNETFKVVGDIANGVGNKVEYVLEYTSDLQMTGSDYGTFMTVSNGSYNAATKGAIITVDGAELNVSYVGTNLDTVADTDDVDFGTLTLSAGATDIKITNLVLTIDETDGNSATGDNWDVDEFELVDQNGGGAYTGTMTNGDLADPSSADADDETWTFDDEIYLTAGESRKFTMRGDLPESIGNGDSYKVTGVLNTTYVTAETVPEGDAVDNFSIGSFTGKTITVKSPTLKVAGLTQNSGTAVVNDADVLLFKGTLEASADDIHVTVADFDANSVFSTDNWTQVGFYTSASTNGPWTQQQLITGSSMTSGTMQFDSLDFTVKNGAANKMYFLVKGTVASTLNGATGATLKFDYFTAKDSNNDDALVIDSGSNDLSGNGSPFLTEGGRTVTLVDKGQLLVQIRNADTGFNKERIVLAGTGFWAGRIKMQAKDESVKVKDLKLTNGSSDDEDSVESVCLYTAATVSSENLIGCATMGSDDVVFFDDINKTVAQGSEYWYIYVNTTGIGEGSSQTADSHDLVQFSITTSTANSLVAEGTRSGFTLTFAGADASSVAAGEFAFDSDMDDSYNEVVDAATTSTVAFHVAGTRISNVSYVSSYGGNTVDSVLSGTGAYTAAIIKVETDATSNASSTTGSALQVQLNALILDMAKYTSTTLSAATIERIGGQDGALSLTVNDPLDEVTSTSGTITGTLSSLMTNDHKISAGDTAYYVVKVTVGAVSTADNIINWFRTDMNDLKGSYNTDTNNNLDWFDGNSGTAFNGLLLDTTNLTGTKVSELN